MPRSNDADGRTRLLRSYATAIAGLPAQTLVVMPERIINIPQSDLQALDRQFWDLAIQFKHPVHLVGGAVWKGTERQTRLASTYLRSRVLSIRSSILFPGLGKSIRLRNERNGSIDQRDERRSCDLPRSLL